MGTIKDYEVNIGKECKKKTDQSTFKKNTIKGVINHPHLNIQLMYSMRMIVMWNVVEEILN
jgi:hypothetical protein